MPLWKSGVYKWTNRVNGKVYIGSAARGILVRYREYTRYLLPRNRCHNQHFQSAWNKYGAQSFVFSIVERCAPSQCVSREEYWIDHYSATDSRFGYNLCKTGKSTLGLKRSEEVREKLRKFRPSQEHKAKLIQSNRTRIWSEETRRKKAEVFRANWKDPEIRARMLAKRPKKVSLETRRKMSEAQKKRRTQEKIDQLIQGKRLSTNPKP